MSIPYLPPEILDGILSILHDEPKTLRNCCLVAKSWVPRARNHLFADITFSLPEALESWKKTFADASNSPAYHTRALSVRCPQAVVETDAEEGGWIQSFFRIERLTVSWMYYESTKISLVLFHGFSSLKSLHLSSLSFPSSHLSNLIHSLPLLEDLALINLISPDMLAMDGPSTIVTPTSPALTGTLELLSFQGITGVARQLLNLPNGLHFRTLDLSWYSKKDHWMAELVFACSNTLEYLNIGSTIDYDGGPRPIDLSKATGLKDVVFRCKTLSNGWAPMTLETITSRHRDLQHISIDIGGILRCRMPGPNITVKMIGEVDPSVRWSELDRLLLQFWDSHSIRPRVIGVQMEGEEEEKPARDWIRYLLPEVTKRGIVDLVE